MILAIRIRIKKDLGLKKPLTQSGFFLFSQ